MSTTQTERRSPMLRVAVVAVTVVLLLVAAGLIQRWRSNAVVGNQLKAVLAELDASEPGWRLADLEAAREVVPLAENSARVIEVIGPLMPTFELTVHLVTLSTNERLPEDWLEKQRKLLGKGKDLLPEARRLADLPRGRFEVAIRPTVAMHGQPEHHRYVRAVGNLLAFDAVERAQAGDIRGALTSCRAAMNAGRSIGDEPVMWAHYQRVLSAWRVAEVAIHSLALGVADEPPLEALQRLALEESSHDGQLLAWRGQRAAMGALFEGLADGTILLNDLPSGAAQIRHRYLIHDTPLRTENVGLMRLATKVVENARLPSHEQSIGETALETAFDHRTRTLRLADEFFLRPSSVGNRQRLSNASLGCLVILLAAERYRSKHDKWPDRLDDLIPGLLKAVPNDPYDGKPLRFRRLPDGVMAYSVGHDGTDDGGALGVVGVTGSRKDEGHRLWDVNKRNQPARPPAKKAKK